MNIIKPEKVLVLFAFLCSITQSQAGILPDTTQMINNIFVGWEGYNPGGVLKITRNGETIFSKTFGYASLENSVKNTTETVFEAGSVSKQFTAASILLLVQKGKLTLEDDIHKYIPELPDYGYTVTIKQLLTHTSGLKDWRNITYLTAWPTLTKVYTQDLALYRICNQQGLNFPPGDQYSYSNTNFDLLSITVSRVSGVPFAEFVQKNLLTPAGMTHSQIRTNFREVIKHKALGYRKSGKTTELRLPFEETAGATGLLTTPEDLTKWNAFIFAEKLGKQVTALRLTQQVLNNGKKIAYAYGAVNVKKINGFTEISHGGLVAGYRAWLAYYPEKGMTVAYMSNTRSLATSVVSRKIAEIFLGKEEPPVYNYISVAANKLKPKVGLYKNANTMGIIELQLKKGELSIRYGDPLKALSENMFIAGNDKIDLSKPDKMFVIDGTDTSFYERVKAFHPSQESLATFTGNFYSPVSLTTIHITAKDGYLMMARHPYDTVRLNPYFTEENTVSFKGFDHGLRVWYTFPKNKRNKKNILVSIPRAYNIPFVKMKK